MFRVVRKRKETKSYNTPDVITQSLEKIRDSLAQLEHRLDQKERESKRVEETLSEAKRVYKETITSMHSVEKRRQLNLIARLQDRATHLQDMKNRIMTTIQRCTVLEQDLEATQENQRTLEYAQVCDIETLQQVMADIDATCIVKAATCSSVVRAVEDPLAKTLNDLERSILQEDCQYQQNSTQERSDLHVQHNTEKGGLYADM